MTTKETYARARIDENLKGKLAHPPATKRPLRKGVPFSIRLEKDNSDILLPIAKRQAMLDSFYDD